MVVIYVWNLTKLISSCWQNNVLSYLLGVFEDEQKEREHSSLQEKLDMELKELDKRLEQKEVCGISSSNYIGWLKSRSNCYFVTSDFTLTYYICLQAEMKRFANPDTSTLKQHYDKKIQELELEKRVLQVCL